MKIAVLMGGFSEERAVSLASGSEVTAALREAGHDVVAIDTMRGVLSSADETRILQANIEALKLDRVSDPSSMVSTSELLNEAGRDLDLFFLALHGGEGEGGTIQALLELTRRPYVGSSSTGCMLAMDKDLSKRLFRDEGIQTAPWLKGERSVEDVVKTLGLPVVVKPVTGGSSIRMSIVHSQDKLNQAVELVKKEPGEFMYEAYIQGREFTVAVVGADTFPVGEIIPRNEYFDFASKYHEGMAQEIFPADIDEELSHQLRRLALEVHQLLRLRDFSRIDFIVNEKGEIFVLEANALPGMSRASLVPKAGVAAGLSFSELCDRIAQEAFQRLSHT